MAVLGSCFFVAKYNHVYTSALHSINRIVKKKYNYTIFFCNY